ncbi:hypothetical protein HOE07_04270 [archaeon]|jgi:hypothetical protein|nr:hypothetical protein [archaeon]
MEHLSIVLEYEIKRISNESQVVHVYRREGNGPEELTHFLEGEVPEEERLEEFICERTHDEDHFGFKNPRTIKFFVREQGKKKAYEYYIVEI